MPGLDLVPIEGLKAVYVQTTNVEMLNEKPDMAFFKNIKAF